VTQPNDVSPLIVDYYEQYLVDQDAAVVIRQASERYTVATLERLSEWGGRMGRRGAVLALGFIGDYTSNAVMGRAMADPDRGVRTLAESGICNLWKRVGSKQQRSQLEKLARLNSSKQHDHALRLATNLIQESPWLAEAWNQRALAHYNRKEFDEAIRDCHQTLELNPYHFPAATGMGKCYLQMRNRVAALEAFRRALRLNPSLDDVRAHIDYLQKTLNEE